MMLKTYIWMAIFLAVNWGGFVVLLIRGMRRESSKTRKRPH